MLKSTFKEVCSKEVKCNGIFYFEINDKTDVNEIASSIRNMYKQCKQTKFMFKNST